ncbi:MAG TPA: hypothetical protein VJ911_08450 [Cryomorphaceae bacterium]|nr:hypothetical protein [Cryomorphaceae bacterium]
MKFINILRHNRKQAVLVSLVLLVLSLIYWHKWNPNSEFYCPDRFWEFIDPVSAIGAFIFTIAILYNQAKEKYFNSLESRLSVDFYYQGKVVMKVEQAYLAAKSDIRSWAQSLGGQMAGERLTFDMNWEDDKPMKIETQHNETFKHYYITIFLTENPLNQDHFKSNTFLKNKNQFKHSEVIVKKEEDNTNCIIWRRKKP